MKVLSLILTSSKLDLLERCYDSIVNQDPHGFELTIKIIVNTLNDKYYQQVVKKYSKLVEVVRTESNGRPGRGHNSCLEYYRQHQDEYDYFSMIDGDDMYYPCAFSQMYKHVEKYNIDLLHLILNDKVHYNNDENFNAKILKYNFWLISAFNDYADWWIKSCPKDPLKYQVADCKTPSRILLANKKIFQTTNPIEYSEKMKLYDDMIAFISFYDAHLRGEINSCYTTDTNIYLYNALNDDSMSYAFTKQKHTEEDRVFRNEVQKYDAFLKNGWKLTDMSYCQVSTPDNFSIKQKMTFCIDKVINYELSVLLNKIENETDEDKLCGYLKKMVSYGFDSQTILIKISKLSLKNPSSFLFILTKLYKQSPTKEILETIINTQLKYGLFIDYNKYLLKKYIGKGINVQINGLEFKDETKPVVCYYTGDTSSFNGNNYKEHQVYGSEIAAINLCKKLSKWYNVIIICNTEKQVYADGVYYINKREYPRIKHIDYFIISRYINAVIEFDLSKVKNVYFLMHDARVHDHYEDIKLPLESFITFYNYLPKLTKVIFVSEWQKQNFTRAFELKFKRKINQDKLQVINNGIDLSLFKKKHKKKNSFIYCSDPSRGLKLLCEILIEVYKTHKDISLDIYFGILPEDIKTQYVDKYDFIKFHGKVSNDFVISKMASTDFWVYPNINSHETFCISCLEAMYSSNVIITREFSALPEVAGENNKECILIPHEYNYEEIKDFTIKQINTIIGD